MARIVDIACFQHDMTYGDFKDLPKRTASDKVLRDKALIIGKNMMDIKEIFCSDVHFACRQICFRWCL